MRVIIADDLAPVRSAIRRLLNECEKFHTCFEVTGEAANFGELMRLTRIQQPDLILLDWELSGLPGSTKSTPDVHTESNRSDKKRNVILASLRSYRSEPKIIVLSSRPEAELSSLQAGADAFVFKGDSPDLLIKAIEELTAP